jgi:DNA-binding IclR family transcriptional regulator
MSESILQTADRALLILEMLAKESMRATDIQKRLELNKSTVHRLMMTLLGRGFVERNESTGIYTIGLKLVEISSIRLNQVELKTEALPYLHRLADKVNMSVQLAIYDEGEAVFIEKVEKYMSFHMYCQTGKRIPLYCSAVGKSLVMDKSNTEILDILRKINFEKFTSRTKENPEEVLTDIMEARMKGYTKDHGEHEDNVYCVAAPIFDYRGKIVAAASLTGFSDKIYEDEGKSVREELMKTCQEISLRLGYIPRNI